MDVLAQSHVAGQRQQSEAKSHALGETCPAAGPSVAQSGFSDAREHRRILVEVRGREVEVLAGLEPTDELDWRIALVLRQLGVLLLRQPVQCLEYQHCIAWRSGTWS